MLALVETSPAVNSSGVDVKFSMTRDTFIWLAIGAVLIAVRLIVLF